MPTLPITLVGGGLVGALLAHLLAQQGFAVEVFEKRPDPRSAGYEEGRSINLALAERGLHALRAAGLADEVMAHAVMMRGRMVHNADTPPALQRYGVDDNEVIWSVARGSLNMLTLQAAEAAGVTFHFGQTLESADFERQVARFRDRSGHLREQPFALLIGADGAGSAVRAAMTRVRSLGERVEALGHGYKELEIPPLAALPPSVREALGREGPFALEPHALHIWPRGGYMCIALPNPEGSFTVTLFLPSSGPYPSFAELTDAGCAARFFEAEFPDLMALMPRFGNDYTQHPAPGLYTLYLDDWHLDRRAVLLGDAAHAIVPFHGQGMNCGFEDALELASLMASCRDDPGAVFAQFQARRKPDADAIAKMALENYVEMRDSVSDARYLARRVLAQRLASAAPTHFMPRYRMVTFTRLPYAYALARGQAQDALMEQWLQHTNDVDAIDLAQAVATLKATLPPLPYPLHG